MAPIIFRLVLLALGLGLTEIGLSSAIGGSIVGWGLVIFVGLPLVLAGSAWFMLPLFEARQQKDGSDDA